MQINFGSFGGGSRSSGGDYSFTSAASSGYNFERDLALIESRRRRNKKLDLKSKSKGKRGSWLLDNLVPDIVEKSVDDIAGALIGTPAGLYEMGKGATLDIRDLVTKGDVTPERLGHMGAAMGTQMYEDLRHPLRHPGYTLMDIFALGSMGLGTTARLGAAAGRYAEMTRGASAASRAFARAGQMAGGMPTSTSGALFRAVPESMNPFRKGMPAGPVERRERGLEGPTAPEAHTATGAPTPTVNPLRAFGQKVKQRTAQKQLASLEQIIKTRPGPTRGKPTASEAEILRDLRGRLGLLGPDPSERVAATLAAREAGIAPGPEPRPERPPVGDIAPDPAAEMLQQRLAERQAANAARQYQGVRSTNPLLAAIPEGIRPPNVAGELQGPSPIPGRPQSQLSLFPDEAPASPLAAFDTQRAPAGYLRSDQPLLEAGPPIPGYPGGYPATPSRFTVGTRRGEGGGFDQQLSLAEEGTLPPFRGVTDPRSREQKLADVAAYEPPQPLVPPKPPASAVRAADAADLRAPRAAGSSAPKRPVATSTEARHAAPDAASVGNESMMNVLADMQAKLEKLTSQSEEGGLAHLTPDEPAKLGRRPNEGGFTSSERAAINQEAAKVTFQFGGEKGTIEAHHPDFSGPAARLEKLLDDDGDVIERRNPDPKTGQMVTETRYTMTLANGKKKGIWAETGVKASEQMKSLIGEYVARGDIGKLTTELDEANLATQTSGAKKRAKAKGKAASSKLTEEGDPTLRDTGYWAAQEKLRAEQAPEKAYYDVSEKNAQMEASRQAAANLEAAGEDVTGSVEQQLSELEGPTAEDLAAMEQDVQGLPPEDIAQAAKLAADPDNPIEFHTKEPKEAKSGKVKALNDKPLQPDEVQALNAKLDPALGQLGLSYNEKGWLKVGDEADVEAKIESLGFEAGESYLIRDALEMAAGETSQGGKLSMKTFVEKLQENFPAEGEAADVLNKLKGVGGGSGVVWRDVVKAFMAPRKREYGKVTARMPTERVVGGVKTRVFDEVSNDQVLLSNNPLVRMAWHTVYGALEALDNPYAQGGRGNFANRQLRRKLEFENREIKQINEMAEAAGIPEVVRKYDAQVAAAQNTKFGGSPIRAWDTVNRGAMMGLLFLKPAYLSANLLGQVGLAMIDHAWNPANIYRSVKLQNELYRDGALAGARSAKIRGATGQGIMESVSPGTPGLSRRVFGAHDFVSRQYAKLLDSPFRDNAFINEAVKQGHDTPEKLAALVDAAPDSALGQEFTQVARRANRNLIDYGRMTPTEKQLIRRIIIFYPWMKGATIYGARFAAEHPAQFAGAVGLGRIGQEQTDELGVMPSYMEKQGVFSVGSRDVPGLGKVPEVMNPASVSILGTPGEVLGMARGLVAGDIKPSEELGESITPAATAALKLFTGTDPFTGAKEDPHKSGIARIGESLFETLPGVRQYEQFQKASAIESGQLDPRSVLQPTSKSEVLGRFLGPGLGAAAGHPLAEYAVNPREMASRGAAEQRTFQSKGEATTTKWKSYTTRARDEAKKLGLDLPPAFGKAMQQKAAREAEISTWEAENGKSSAYDRLQSDMRVLVRRGDYSDKDAKDLLDQAAGLDEKSITSFRRKLTDAYFGGEITSYYKKLLSAAGADIDHGW